MTWPLSGWIFSSSSSSSMEEDDDGDSEFNNSNSDADVSSFQDDAINNEPHEKIATSNVNQSEQNFPPDEDHIPTAIATTDNGENNLVTIALPSQGVVCDDVNQRRRFQRRNTIWSNDDEIELLRGFLEYTSQNGINSHRLHQKEASEFYRIIKPKIQLDCDKNQLIEKLRRLKRKYKSISSDMNSDEKTTTAFRSPQDRLTFYISRKIWGHNLGKKRISSSDEVSNEEITDIKPNISKVKIENSNDEFNAENPRKRRRKLLISSEVSNSNDMSPTASRIIIDDISKISGLVEEVTRGCLSPFFKELITSNKLPPFCTTGRIGKSGSEATEDRWRKQQILEMEVYMKRLELVQQEIKASLDKLKSTETADIQ